MTLANFVPHFRNLYAAQLTDTITFRLMTTRGTINNTTLQFDSQADSVQYGPAGSCLIRPGTGEEDRIEFGQEARTFTEFTVLLPHDADGVTLDSVGTVDSCAYDNDLVGALLVVRAVNKDSFGARRKLMCELDLGSGVQQ